MPSVAPPPREVESICLLRLSALGDVTHVLPLVHTLQRACLGMPISWIIGRAERRLLEGLPGVTFLEYDKRSGVAGMRSEEHTSEVQSLMTSSYAVFRLKK